MSAEDCNPNKSLRTTIKVFLRTAEKKREALKAKEAKESEPPTPVEAPKPELPVEAATAEASTESAQNGDMQIEEAAPQPHAEQSQEVVQPDEVRLSSPVHIGSCCN